MASGSQRCACRFLLAAILCISSALLPTQYVSANSPENTNKTANNTTDHTTDNTIRDPVEYWILGSYASPDNARQQQQRLEQALGVTIDIRRSQSGFYRLIVPVSDLAAIPRHRLPADAWRARLSAAVTTDAGARVKSASKEPVTSSEPAHKTEVSGLGEAVSVNLPTPADALEPTTTPTAEASLPHFVPGQTLDEYCEALTQDLPAFCEPELRQAINASIRQLDSRSRSLRVFCEAAPAAAVQLCRQLNPL